ncbi:hypothetical protein ACFXGE_46390, partial [Streptomyces sp. NPDC059378]
MFLAYATGRGRTLIDRRLYLPRSCDGRPPALPQGRDRRPHRLRDECGDGQGDGPQGEIADRIPFGWVTADAAYGFSKGWRTELERTDVFHVMATTRHDTVVIRWALDRPVHDLFPGLPRQKRKRLSSGARAHGQRIYHWARVEVRPHHRGDRGHRVIARRRVGRARRSPTASPTAPTAPHSTSSSGSPAAGGRSRNASRARSRNAAWTTTRSAATRPAPPHDPRHGRPRLPHRPARPPAGHGQSRNGSSRLIHLSLAEIRRLITRLPDRQPPPIDHILHWSTWRRQRQHQARISHYPAPALARSGHR